jgi:hypothetical protein
VRARPLALLRQLFTHKLEPGDQIDLDGPEEESGRIGYTVTGKDGAVKSCGVTTDFITAAPWRSDGSITFPFERGDLEVLTNLAHVCDDLRLNVIVVSDRARFSVDGHVRDSARHLCVVGATLNAALREFLSLVPGSADSFRKTFARAAEAGVMVEPGWYWGQPDALDLVQIGRVLDYESICGPRGTVWHGNEAVPVADMYYLGPQVKMGDATPTPPIPYKPAKLQHPWRSTNRCDTISAEQWNELCPVGTPVRYWPISKVDECFDTVTRSEAWELGHGEPVVKLAHWTGGIALSHLQKLAHIVVTDGDSND